MTRPAAPIVRQPATPSVDGDEPLRILYVEDEELIRRVCERVLMNAGYSVTTVVDGCEGWAALEGGAYDLVVTDHDMPRLTGMQLVTKARAKGLTIPFILASGSAGNFAGINDQSLGIAALIPKPFTANELLETVRLVLRAAAIPRREEEVSPPTMRDEKIQSTAFSRWGLNE